MIAPRLMERRGGFGVGDAGTDRVCRWAGGVMLACAQRPSEVGTSRPDPRQAQWRVSQHSNPTGQAFQTP